MASQNPSGLFSVGRAGPLPPCLKEKAQEAIPAATSSLEYIGGGGGVLRFRAWAKVALSVRRAPFFLSQPYWLSLSGGREVGQRGRGLKGSKKALKKASGSGKLSQLSAPQQ